MLKVAVLAASLAAAAGKAKFEDKWEKFCGVPDCYTELGLVPNATKAQIRRQYRTLSLEFHPDKNPSPDARDVFGRAEAAYELLAAEFKRERAAKGGDL